MTDTTLTPNEPVPQAPKSINAAEQIEAEGEAGKAAAEGNAAQREKADQVRLDEAKAAREAYADARAAANEEWKKLADEIKGMVGEELPPPGPGMPRPNPIAIMATMDPNNPLLNPDVSKMGSLLNLPPGARVPRPVLPQDAVETQYASKPPTEEHAKAGEDNLGLVNPPIHPDLSNLPMLGYEGAGEAATAPAPAPLPPPA
jgi:hypothetical protein